MPRDAIFFSYSHVDAKWLAALQKLLKPALKNLSIKTWADTDLKPGTKWRPAIEEALNSAKIAVLLVSSDFLASEFIDQHELPPLLDAAENDGLTILWVYVDACMYSYTTIADYQAAHDISKPLKVLKPAQRQLALLSIANAIVDAYRGERPSTGLFVERPLNEIPPSIER
jgi:hypothetical protein